MTLIFKGVKPSAIFYQGKQISAVFYGGKRVWPDPYTTDDKLSCTACNYNRNDSCCYVYFSVNKDRMLLSDLNWQIRAGTSNNYFYTAPTYPFPTSSQTSPSNSFAFDGNWTNYGGNYNGTCWWGSPTTFAIKINYLKSSDKNNLKLLLYKIN